MAIQSSFCANPACPLHEVKINDKEIAVSIQIGDRFFEYQRRRFCTKEHEVLFFCSACLEAYNMIIDLI